MRVLVGCEFSGIVRDAFIKAGHDAWSVDLLPSESNGPHIQGDILQVAYSPRCNWDLMICHPPCTYLCVSGAMHQYMNPPRLKKQDKALQFVCDLLNAPIPRIALENPVSVIATRICPSTQTIQPWMFGHGEMKTTCLWLHNVPMLKPTNIVPGREQRIWKASPSKDRWKFRSRTYQGVADAMAQQWGKLPKLALDLNRRMVRVRTKSAS